ncbi:aldehyde-activating protein [Roseibium aquae]|uniref:Aldehyde-activating protein n=1 Tax=Roseibium aquae TaxID=1323746 RepID=A0A916TGD3_9HYPH|nr:GFA family protein [Roseibium aquae]GGB42665.1 aldehyde-activating protein [Roseibium aquae]
MDKAGFKSYTGGCQCGAVRFKVDGTLGEASICHCRMCQKAFGNFFAPLVDARREHLTWTRGEPSFFASSDAVDRGFCSACGTPLVFAYRDYPLIGLAIGAFDDPGAIPVTKQHWTSHQVAGTAGLFRLPSQPEDEPEFMDLIAKIDVSNHQHPDHDTPHWPMRPDMPDGPEK